MRKFIIDKDDSIFQLENMDIGYMDYGSDESAHTHSFIEVVCVVDGTGEQVIDGNRIFCSRGSVIVMEQGVLHSIENITPFKYYNLRLTPDFISAKLSPDDGIEKLFAHCGFDISGKYFQLRITDEKLIDKFDELFFTLLDEGLNKPRGYKQIGESVVREILVNIGRNYPQYISRQQKKDEELNKIVEYIENHCCEKISLEETAEYFGYEPSYFSRKLKNYLGFSFKQILLRKRIAKSIPYLWKSDDSIEEIITKCGFSKKSYYYKAFEKQYGVKPNKMRSYSIDYFAHMRGLVEKKKSQKDTFEDKFL